MKQGNNQASSVIATNERLLTSSEIAVIPIMVIALPIVFGIDSRFVWMTLKPSPRKERVRYWPTGYFGIPKSKPKAYSGHMS